MTISKDTAAYFNAIARGELSLDAEHARLMRSLVMPVDPLVQAADEALAEYRANLAARDDGEGA